MADNIINPKDMVEQVGQSDNGFTSSEQPNEGLSQRFTGLITGERDEGLPVQSMQPVQPEQFSDLGRTDDTVLGSAQNRQSEFDAVEAVEQESLAESLWVTDNHSTTGNSPVLGENMESIAQAGTLGDKILRGMQTIREQVEQGARQVESNIDPAREAMSMREMFETQWTMTNLMLTEDYIGKVVSKGTQAFDTLLRNQ